MAALHLAQGDQEAVTRVVTRALQVAPNDPDTILNSAALMWEKEFKKGTSRDASVSGELVERALALDPTHVGALCFRGMWFLQAHDDIERGLECMERCERVIKVCIRPNLF